MNSTCKYCKSQVLENFYFCPNCGKKIKEPPYKFSWGKTITILLESVLLPPFGLFPGVKLLKTNNTGARILGTVAIILTVISVIISTIFLRNFINNVSKTYSDIYQTQGLINNPSGSVQNQIDQLQNANQ